MSNKVLVMIDNNDDGLTQLEWAQVVDIVDRTLRRHETHRHGGWVSASSEPVQNAVWLVQIEDAMVTACQTSLARQLAPYGVGDRPVLAAWMTVMTTDYVVRVR